LAPGSGFDELERHIESCPACQSVLEKLAHQESSGEKPLASLNADRTVLPEIVGFVIEEELGRGSMGVVYRAWQGRLARRVAIKVVSDDPIAGTRVRDYWLREAHSAARVRDPRIVQVHDVGEANGCLYLVLEYVPGGSLKDRLDGPLPALASAALVEKIAGGVAAVHRAGLLHLDLKPSNILIDSDPGTPWESCFPKVADFGIAREAEDTGMSRTSLRGPWGTPSYMAPEQVAPGRLAVGPVSDVYALGAILYELLTGRPPFRSASLAETMEQIRHQEPAPPRRLNPSIPLDLETICTTCLRKDPKQRYPTAEALSDDLRRWLERRPITARPVSHLERVWRWARRRPLTAALAAGLAATLIAGPVSLTVLWRRAESERQRAESLHELALANYEVASDSLRAVSEFANQVILGRRTQWTFPAFFDRALEEAQARQRELLQKNVLESRGLEQLATVDLVLATVYRARPNKDEAVRSLLNESIALWDQAIARGANVENARAHQLSALLYLPLLGKEGSIESENRRWEITPALVYRELCGRNHHAARLFELSRAERERADYVANLGQPERARQFLSGKLRLFDSLIETRGESPELVFARALTLAALGTSVPITFTTRLKQDEVRTPGNPLHEIVTDAIAELTVRTYGLRALGPVRSDPEGADPDYAARAKQAVAFVAAHALQLGLDREALPRIAWGMKYRIVTMESHLRVVGKLEQARRNARFFRALATEFVRNCPGSAEPYLMACEAELQDAKNAFRSDDRTEVGRALERSLEAALKAQSVEPTSEEAREVIQDRRQRLYRHASDRS
jgi:serine/threonine protein kinase